MITKLMKLIFIVLILSIKSTFAQNPEQLIKDINDKCSKTWANLGYYETVDTALTLEVSEGGNVRAFYDNKDLKLLDVNKYGETGKYNILYFFDKDKLIFASEQISQYNRPINWDSKKSKENNDNEVYDPKKTVVIENNYYFHHNKLVLWLDKDKSEMDISLKSTDHFLDEATNLKNLLKE